jgi:alginate O-acetyltransferase complex protein AlgI
MTWSNPQLICWAMGLLLAAWLLPRRWQVTAMAVVGLGFLGFVSPPSLLVLSGLGLTGFVLALNSRGKIWRVLALLAVAIATIVFFKWGTRLGGGVSRKIVPLGLAFYCLRVVHYAIEAYAGRLPQHRLLDYARYLFFLPTLAAGPINRFAEFQRDSNRRRWDSGLFALGLERILYGYFKIMVLGNMLIHKNFGRLLSGFEDYSDWAIEYLRCLQYGANLYFQFAGYSEVAIGLALLVGYRIPENFNWPFLACNIADFWKRWHMTLAGWCRDYVFMPVSAWTRRPAVGVICSMLILGLWHEISLRYLVWGLYHGAGIVIMHGFQKIKTRYSWCKSPRLSLVGLLLSWILTANFVILGFAITKEDCLADAWESLLTILTMRT